MNTTTTNQMKQSLKSLIKRFAAVVMFVFLCLNLTAHPIKMSTAKLSGKAETGKLVLTINFFEDDLLDYFRELYKIPVFQYGDEKEMFHEALDDYVNQHLDIKINGKQLHFTIENTEQNQENVVTVHFHSHAPCELKCIELVEIKNKILFDAFRDQSNMMVIDLNPLNQRENLRFFKHQPVQKLGLETADDCAQ